jgi:hypothetical protein
MGGRRWLRDRAISLDIKRVAKRLRVRTPEGRVISACVDFVLQLSRRDNKGTVVVVRFCEMYESVGGVRGHFAA